MIACLRTHVRKQPVIALLFESENELKFYSLKARSRSELFDTLMLFLEEFFEKVDFEKKTTDDKHKLLPIRQRVNYQSFAHAYNWASFH